MKPETWFKFVQEAGLPTAFAVFLLIALVYIVRFLVKEHKEERERLYEQAQKTGEKVAESNEKLADALTELKIIIKARGDQ